MYYWINREMQTGFVWYAIFWSAYDSHSHAHNRSSSLPMAYNLQPYFILAPKSDGYQVMYIHVHICRKRRYTCTWHDTYRWGRLAQKKKAGLGLWRWLASVISNHVPRRQHDAWGKLFRLLLMIGCWVGILRRAENVCYIAQ